MTDILTRARGHEWWHSDRMLAEDLMFEIIKLRQFIRELEEENLAQHKKITQMAERAGGCY